LATAENHTSETGFARCSANSLSPVDHAPKKRDEGRATNGSYCRERAGHASVDRKMTDEAEAVKDGFADRLVPTPRRGGDR
jgi:hypothetical protein